MFDRLLAARPRDPEAHLCRGLLLWKTGNGEGGLAAVEKALELDPKMLEAMIHRARILRSLGRDADARRACAEAIQKGPRFVDGYLLAAELVLEAGRPDDALGYCDKALALHAGEPEAWRLKAAAHEKAGRASAAAVCLGLHHLHRGAPEQALADMEAVIAKEPGFVHAWTHKGAALERLGRLEEALAAYDRAIELDPRDSKVHLARGLLLHERLNRGLDGITALKKAVGLDAKRWNDLPETLQKRIDKPRFW
jgi:superkiller protein 3